MKSQTKLKKLVEKLELLPVDNMYLEKGELQKEICVLLKMDYYSVKTADFENAVKKIKGGI